MFNFISKLFGNNNTQLEKVHVEAIPIQEPIKVPIRWKSLVPTDITIEMRDDAFKAIFGFPVEECKILNVSNSGINQGLTVLTPNGSLHSNGGFGYHTDNPELKNTEDVWYKGGITWGIDLNSQRYYRIDKDTLLPTNWEEVKNMYILSIALDSFEDLIQ